MEYKRAKIEENLERLKYHNHRPLSINNHYAITRYVNPHSVKSHHQEVVTLHTRLPY